MPSHDRCSKVCFRRIIAHVWEYLNGILQIFSVSFHRLIVPESTRMWGKFSTVGDKTAAQLYSKVKTLCEVTCWCVKRYWSVVKTMVWQDQLRTPAENPIPTRWNLETCRHIVCVCKTPISKMSHAPSGLKGNTTTKGVEYKTSSSVSACEKKTFERFFSGSRRYLLRTGHWQFPTGGAHNQARRQQLSTAVLTHWRRTLQLYDLHTSTIESSLLSTYRCRLYTHGSCWAIFRWR